MSFYEVYREFESKSSDIEAEIASCSHKTVERVLDKDRLSYQDFMTLLSPAAGDYLEEMARQTHVITLKQFGRAVSLYTPMYLSDYCSNYCLYCSFSARNKFPRRKLKIEDIDREAREIYRLGFRQVLILTGESRQHSPPKYLKEAVKRLRTYFPQLSIEVYPLETEEYRELVEEGIYGLTIYQETYDQEIYKKVHPRGYKSNMKYRMLAPERALNGGIHGVNIGALFGLAPWRTEAFFTGLHAYYLQEKYPEAELSVSVPRMRPFAGSDFTPDYPVSDRELVQIMLAYRLFLHRVGINISTRESPSLRDNLIPLGVTKMSASSTTRVGGHSSGEERVGQFEISDDRDVFEIKKVLLKSGYQPVMKDWEPLYKVN